MYRRDKQARLLTGGLIGALPVTTPGDEHWNDVSLLIRGDSLTDLSGNHTPVANNGAAAGDPSPVKFASGSMSFDGVNDYISIPDSDLFAFGSGDFTIEFWAYHIGSFDRYTSVCGNRASGNHYGPFGIVSGGDGAYDNQIRFFAGEGTGSTNSVMLIDPDDFPLNQWVHLAVTREGTTFTLWINGQSKATGTGSWSMYNASEPMYLGKDVTAAGANMWNGNIEDFRITKGVARYTANFTPPTASFLTNAPVVGRRGVGTYDAGDEHWDDVSLLIRGDTLTDLSDNAHTVSENGSTPLYNDTTTTKYASGSLTFDGASDYVSVPDDPSLELGSGDFTIECWAYHSGTLPTKATITGKRSDYSDYAPYLLNSGVNAGLGKMRFLASAGSNWDIIITDTDTFPIDQWVHVAVTRAGNVFTLWINGQSKVTTTAAITLMDNSAPLCIGRGSVTTGGDLNDWNGNIEDFRVTKGIARYTAAFTPPTKSLPTALAGTPEATATLRTRGYVGAAPAGSGGMLTLYDRFVPQRWDGSGAEFLLVGGGGSGGRGPGPGGGGAGGMVVGTNQTFSLSTPYSLVIGKGGDHLAQGIEDNGDPSTFEGYLASNFQSLDAEGGGRGIQGVYNTASPGASGGSGGGGSTGFQQGPLAGGAKTQATYSGLTGIAGHGNAGGTSSGWTPNNEYYGAGGGGAGSAGVNGVNSTRLAGNGGDGRQWAVDGQYYAGGGGGSAFDDWPNGATVGLGGRGSGGLGGGGDGYWRNYSGSVLAPDDGSPNTGGGGGGGSGGPIQNGKGGSGVFKIWIPLANYTNYVVGSELTEAASQQVTYGGTAGTLITITASSGTTTNTITFN